MHLGCFEFIFDEESYECDDIVLTLSIGTLLSHRRPSKYEKQLIT